MAYFATLDEDVIEWQVFQSIQPVFTAALEKRNKEALKPSDIESFFKLDMMDLSYNYPSHTLSKPDLKQCTSNLTKLLDILEEFVSEGVVKAAAEKSPQSLPYRILAWVETVGPYWISSTSPTTPQFLGSPETKEINRVVTTQTYHKLRALGTLRDQHEYAIQFLNLAQPNSKFEEAVQAMGYLKQDFKSLTIIQLGKDNTQIADTKWDNLVCHQASLELYKLVRRGSTMCGHHQAKLLLGGTLSNCSIKPFTVDVFLSPCQKSSPGADSWRHTQITRLPR